MDLLDWHRGELSSRRLSVLVEHLPRDSALARELHGEAAEWTVSDYLLAHAVDQLQEANWMFATVNRDEDSEPLDLPTPIHRPGRQGPPHTEAPAETPPETPNALPTPQEMQRFFS